MISRTSPAFTVVPTSTNGFAPGSGARYAVPTIGEATTPGCREGSTAPGDATGTAADMISMPCEAAGATLTAVEVTLRATRRRRPSCSISISVRPVSSSRCANARMASSSISTLPLATSFLCGRRPTASSLRVPADGGEPVDREPVALDPEAADHGFRPLGDVGIVSEGLALVDIGDVHFDHRQLHAQDRVENGD